MKQPRQLTLFIPCLVDQVCPEIGRDMVRLLRHLGFELAYNPAQTCCGQPAFNAGHWEEARRVAGAWLDAFRDAETIICPSGSCSAMVRHFYRDLFADTPRAAAAAAIGERVVEFSQLLVRTRCLDRLAGRWHGVVGFHNSCHSYRELGISDEPLQVLARVTGCEDVRIPAGEPVCCGFGGLFCVKFEAVAGAMAKSRLEQFTDLGVETLVVNDPGCIVHLRQEQDILGLKLRILHLAEFLCASGAAGTEEDD